MEEGLLLGFASVEDHHWWFVGRRRIVLDTLRPVLGDESAPVLEVGCGTGGTLRALREQFPQARIRAVEPNAEAAMLAERSGCPVETATCEELPFDDGEFAVLLALDVLEHCEDDVRALREAWRVVRPGGTLLLTVPALPSLWSRHDETNHHYRRYTRRTLAQAVDTAGFERQRLSYFNSLLLPLGWVARMVSRFTAPTSELGVTVPPAPVNRLFLFTFSLERRLMRHLDLPIGMSLLVVARKPSVGGQSPRA